MAGVLFLVVGPSGVGKDSVLNGARAVLSPDNRFVFARRVITRVADPAAEDHDTLDMAAFEAAEIAGAFALSWRAHDLGYGIPTAIEQDLAEGRSVIANVSRTIIEDTARRFSSVHTLAITASPNVIAKRLAARGRETAEEIEKRIRRTVQLPEGVENLHPIENNDDLKGAIDLFVTKVRTVHEEQQQVG